MARRGINPKINELSTIMFAVLLTLLIIINKQKNNGKYKKEEKRSRI